MELRLLHQLTKVLLFQALALRLWPRVGELIVDVQTAEILIAGHESLVGVVLVDMEQDFEEESGVAFGYYRVLGHEPPEAQVVAAVVVEEFEEQSDGFLNCPRNTSFMPATM